MMARAGVRARVLLLVLAAACAAMEPEILSQDGSIVLAVDANQTITFKTGASTVQTADLATMAWVQAQLASTTAILNASIIQAAAQISDLQRTVNTLSSLLAGQAAASYQSGWSATPASGWRYYFNTGSIGISSQYAPLAYNSALLAWVPTGDGYPGSTTGYLALLPTGGRTGLVSSQTGNFNRYAIAAFTVPAAGIYFLANTTVAAAGACAVGVAIRVYVNDNLVRVASMPAQGNTTFDVVLGSLQAGATVYVAAAAAASTAACASPLEFTWNFGLQQFSTSNTAAAMVAASAVAPNALVVSGERACEPMDVGVLFTSGSSLQLCSAGTVSQYVSSAAQASALSAYVTRSAFSSNLTSTLANYVTSTLLSSSYVTNASLTTTLGMYVPASSFSSTVGIVTANISSMSSSLQTLGGSIVAGYRRDYANPPGNGWQYMYNGYGDPIGAIASYVSLSWNPTLTFDSSPAGVYAGASSGTPPFPIAGWAMLTSIGGHAANSFTDGGASPYNPYTRWTIAAYTTQTDGAFAIVNSTLDSTPAKCGAFLRLRVYVNTTLLRDQYIHRSETKVNFDTALGYLLKNNTVYIAVGPGDDGNSCDHFYWDFSIWSFSSSNALALAFSSPLAAARIYSGIQATFEGYRRSFRSAANAKEGWLYQWNGKGPIGNPANYVNLVWDSVQEYSATGSSVFPNANSNLSYGQLTPTGGHTGPSGSTDAARSGGIDRYVIAGFVIQYANTYQITNSYFTATGASTCNTNNVALVVYVNGVVKVTTSVAHSATVYFNTALGYLVAGDVVYVAAGPIGTDGCNSFVWDYVIRETYAGWGIHDAIAGADYGTTPGPQTGYLL